MFSYVPDLSNKILINEQCRGINKSFYVDKRQVDMKKGWIAGVPVVHKSTYETPRVTIYDTDIAIMHGSRRGISRRHGDRVYEYEYYFCRWLGRRFAKHVNNGGKQIVRIKTSRDMVSDNMHQVETCCRSDFSHAFQRHSNNSGLSARILQGHTEKYKGNVIYSDVYLICCSSESDLYIIEQSLIEADILCKKNPPI